MIFRARIACMGWKNVSQHLFARLKSVFPYRKLSVTKITVEWSNMEEQTRHNPSRRHHRFFAMACWCSRLTSPHKKTKHNYDGSGCVTNVSGLLFAVCQVWFELVGKHVMYVVLLFGCLCVNVCMCACVCVCVCVCVRFFC